MTALGAMMARLVVTSRKGERITVDAAPGLSVMEIIRDQGFAELQALCGGGCSCATCHVKIDVEDLRLLPSIGIEEDRLLDMSNHRDATSRLSCQIIFGHQLDGLRVTIARGG